MEKIELDRKGKIKNWIYYHRYHIIAAALLIGFLIFVAVSADNREDYDTLLFYAGPCYFSENAAQGIEEAFERVGEDYNKNGRKEYALISLTILSGDQIVQAQKDAKDESEILFMGDIKQNKSDFYDQISAGDAVVCLIDEYYYKDTRDKGRLVKITDITGGTLPQGALEDGYGIRLCDCAFGKYFACFSTLPDTTILCLKKQTLTMNDEDYRAGKELFLSVAGFDAE